MTIASLTDLNKRLQSKDDICGLAAPDPGERSTRPTAAWDDDQLGLLAYLGQGQPRLRPCNSRI